MLPPAIERFGMALTRVGAQTAVYCLSDGATLPAWVKSDRARRQALKEDSALGRRIDLLQDFEFEGGTRGGEGTSKRIKFSSDGNYILATGEYPPAVKVFDLTQLGMKYERRLGCECVDALPLSPDLGKMVFLLADRTLDFHAPYGTHYKTRVPTAGRRLFYDGARCSLLIPSAKGKVHRMDLDVGKFDEDLDLGSPASCVAAPAHGGVPLVGFGCEDGACRFFDLRAARDRKPVATLDVGNDVTALAFDFEGMHVACGTHDAYVATYAPKHAYLRAPTAERALCASARAALAGRGDWAVRAELPGDVFSFPLLREDFCRDVAEECAHYLAFREAWVAKRGGEAPPGTLRERLTVAEVGLGALEGFLLETLGPLIRRLFPGPARGRRLSYEFFAPPTPPAAGRRRRPRARVHGRLRRGRGRGAQRDAPGAHPPHGRRRGHAQRLPRGPVRRGAPQVPRAADAGDGPPHGPPARGRARLRPRARPRRAPPRRPLPRGRGRHVGRAPRPHLLFQVRGRVPREPLPLLPQVPPRRLRLLAVLELTQAAAPFFVSAIWTSVVTPAVSSRGSGRTRRATASRRSRPSGPAGA